MKGFVRSRLLAAALASPVIAALCACGNLTGLQATSEYACKAPDGIKCDSVSGTYWNALQNNLPAQRPRQSPGGDAGKAPTVAEDPSTRATPALPSGQPTWAVAPDRAAIEPASAIRSQSKVLRLWIKPWEDSDRDLHDQGFVYVQVDSGRWLVDRAQRQIRDAYAPVRAPRAHSGAAGAAAANASAAPSSASGPASASNPAMAQALRALQQSARDPQIPLPDEER